MQRTINIFLASSNDLKEERDSIDLMIAKENEHLEKESIRLELVRWEDMLQSFQPTSFQDSINDLRISTPFLRHIFLVCTIKALKNNISFVRLA
jgi:hypothetical protein